MSLDKNKAIVCKFIEAYNERKLHLIDDFVSPDYVDHSNNLGREGLKQIIASARFESSMFVKCNLARISLFMFSAKNISKSSRYFNFESPPSFFGTLI